MGTLVTVTLYAAGKSNMRRTSFEIKEYYYSLRFLFVGRKLGMIANFFRNYTFSAKWSQLYMRIYTLFICDCS